MAERAARGIELRPHADTGSAIVAVSEDASFAGRVQVFSDDDLTDEPGFAAVETRRASRRPGWDFHRIRDQTSRLRLTDGRPDGLNEYAARREVQRRTTATDITWAVLVNRWSRRAGSRT